MRVVDIKQEDYQVSPRLVKGASGSVVNEGVGIAQLAQSQTRDLKVASLNPVSYTHLTLPTTAEV